ncbi:MAG TPA: hypothetical protein VFI19_10850 [Nocardioides sp.]|nr:hypothetical protein [Nocardioides sp.]
MKSLAAPDGVPILSPGRHRSPRRGACFMEFASFLAGERWSDHPTCTHPLLAQLARRVNDLISDEGRQQLVPLIPMVVGRHGDDRTWLTLPVAVAAAPILDVPEPTQRVLAAGLLSAHQVCDEAGPDFAETGRQARAALDLVPGAVAWVERLGVSARISPKIFANRCAPTMIRCAVDGIEMSGSADCDARLRALLETAISACPAPARVDRVPEVADAS